MGLGLVLTLQNGEEVYLGDHRFVVQIESEDVVRLVADDDSETVVSRYKWADLITVKAEVILAQKHHTDFERGLREARLQFNAPGLLILRGAKYRKGKERA